MIATRLFKLLFKNFGFKLLSIFFAILLWIIIQGEQIDELNREISISINVPEGYAIRGPLIRTKSVTIRGPRVWMLEAPGQLQAVVNIPEGTTGSFKMRIGKDQISDWNERLLLTVHDPFLELFVDRKVERIVAVKEVLQGIPADGFFVEQVELSPMFVKVSGVRTDVARVRHVSTEPIDVNGIAESKQVEVKLIPPTDIMPENISIERVKVQLKVGDRKANRRFDNIPIEVNAGDYETIVRPSKISVLVQGTAGVLSFIDNEDFRASVDSIGLVPGRYEQEVRLRIPPDTVLIETFPERVVLTVRKKPTAKVVDELPLNGPTKLPQK